MAVRVLLSGASSPLGVLVRRELDRRGVEVLTAEDAPAGAPGSRSALAALLAAADVVVETGVAGTSAEYGTAVGSGAAGGGERAAGPETRAAALLAALTEHPPRRYVLASTGSVYGASARNPALFGEDHSGHRVSRRVADRYSDRYSEPAGRGLAELPRGVAGGVVEEARGAGVGAVGAGAAGEVPDLVAHRLGAPGSSETAVALERYVRGTARRCPDTAFTVLRLAEVVGPTSRSAFADLLRSPVVPMVAGYDPRLSLLHEDDAATAVALAATRDGRTDPTSPALSPGPAAAGRAPAAVPPPGGAGGAAGRVEVLNVAGRGAVSVSAVAHGLGRLRVFVPGPLLGAGPGRIPPALRALLTHGRCLDVGRLAAALDWTPDLDGRAVVHALAAERGTSVAGLLRGVAADVVGGLAPAGWGALADLLHPRDRR